MKKERMKVLAVDHALRRETQRASRLAEELQRVSITRDKLNPILSPGCVYKVTLPAFPVAHPAHSYTVFFVFMTILLAICGSGHDMCILL